MNPPPRLDSAPLCPVLIGRDHRLALADRRCAAARAGTGHLLFLSGEAGIGKSRLLTEVCAPASGRDFMVVGAAAYPRDGEIAGGVLADLDAALRRLPAGRAAGRGPAPGRRYRGAAARAGGRRRTGPPLPAPSPSRVRDPGMHPVPTRRPSLSITFSSATLSPWSPVFA